LIAPRLHRAEDNIKPLVWIILIQARLKIRRHSSIGEIHCAPFNVEDAIRRTARNRSKDAATASEVRTTIADYIGAHVCPKRENGVVIRAYVWRSRQASRQVAKWLVDTHEVEPPIGVHVHSIKGLIA
jgi:hypothetical protein